MKFNQVLNVVREGQRTFFSHTHLGGYFYVDPDGMFQFFNSEGLVIHAPLWISDFDRDDWWVVTTAEIASAVKFHFVTAFAVNERTESGLKRLRSTIKHNLDTPEIIYVANRFGDVPDDYQYVLGFNEEGVYQFDRCKTTVDLVVRN